MVTSDDKIRQVATMAQDYYDSDDVFNYYRQVTTEIIATLKTGESRSC